MSTTTRTSRKKTSPMAARKASDKARNGALKKSKK